MNRLIQFMYLNTITNNVLLTTVKGTPVLKYGHFNDRLKSRVKRIRKATNCNELTAIALENKALATINNIYDELVKGGRGNKPYKVLVNYQLPVNVKGNTVIIETSMLITCSKAMFNRRLENQNIDPAYAKYVADGTIVEGKPVICMETIVVTARIENEKRIAFSDFNYRTVENIKCVARKEMNSEALKNIIKIINEERAQITDKVRGIARSL